ncbi:DUF92 domain-containing protein [Rubrobacter radiotolerans]|uniref:DUF92 domain-containing protein n=2 Tax=Rubrobacter radiotolerans TaxID=42256 RepID=A0AB35SYL1_RUBRA|nr:DUF92 domain-containing protein [Rubrobacter radiotolerans]MDX5892684.1 DUF92 domain-containing protein [Rubrobacter radiotolerans]SMC08116.1 TIGR00297 family protein [Rubrobacter radiotolerans DSM 5868]
MLSSVLIAAAVTALFAALAYALGMVGRSGALGGFVIGTAVFLFSGPEGFALLALFVLGGSALTKLGYGRKSRAGTAETYGGRRGARNALANCSVAVLLAALYAVTGSGALLVAFAASLGAAFADTAESEVGQLYGGEPRLITDLRPVPPGTDGAVSLPGTLAGLAAAALMAFAALVLGIADGTGAALIVAVAGFAGTLADSLIGAKLPQLGNEATNLACTLVAAGISLLLLALV